MHNIMKKSDLNFIFMENFLKKDYLFWMNAKFRVKLVLYWNKDYAEFCAKKPFVQNHATITQENWLFRGNQYVKKKLLTLFNTNKKQDLKKAVMYGGGSFLA